MKTAESMIAGALCVHFIILSFTINSPSRLQGGKQQCFPTSITAFFKNYLFYRIFRAISFYTVQVNY